VVPVPVAPVLVGPASPGLLPAEPPLVVEPRAVEPPVVEPRIIEPRPTPALTPAPATPTPAVEQIPAPVPSAAGQAEPELRFGSP
jgi:hypothetical protein